MLITDLRSFIGLIKDILPFAVCIITFVAALFLYKVALKTDRRNPFIYILSSISVIGLYFSFIKIFGLRRTDYFLDGFTIFMEQLEGILTSCLLLTISIFSILKCIDFSMLTPLFLCLMTLVITCGIYKDYIVLAFESVFFFLLEVKENKFDNLLNKFINKCFAFTNIQSLNCVFNC